MKTILLGTEEVRENTPFAELIPMLEETFISFENDNSQMPARSYIYTPEHNGNLVSMPAYVQTDEWDAVGMKWVNYHGDNKDVPAVMGTAVLNQPETGFPLAVLNGTELTSRRTGAAAALATDYLAIEDASTLGIVGAGVQSSFQVRAISEIRPIEEIVVSDPDDAAVEAFIDEFDDEFEVRRGSIEEAMACDVVSTITPVMDPIVADEMVSGHTHINAMGSDEPDKQELEVSVLQDAAVFIDHWEQALYSGEVSNPFEDDIMSRKDINGTIGSLMVENSDANLDELRENVSVFDSTGLAIQDVATAKLAYENVDKDECNTVDLV